jgi:CubicO group peptidase (beta-lactamase class C family)
MNRFPTIAALLLAPLSTMRAASPPVVFPEEHWEKLESPERHGWSAAKLDEAHRFAKAAGSAALLIVHQGLIVDDWGATTQRFNVHSIRKSFLSALIGQEVAAGNIRLGDTLEKLGIDDNEPGLTPTEKQATVADLLKARSGVYHPANYETDSMKGRRPERGSHPHDTFFFYNNWDFNALGSIYERATNRSVFEGFQRGLAEPLQMEDFRLEDTEYVRGPVSRHPAYLFRLAARDMARVGLLYARGGQWRGKQLVPANWVADSVVPYSPATKSNGRAYAGYGYLWWTSWEGKQFENVKLPDGSFSARGHGGHVILAAPALDLVVVHRVNTEEKGGASVEYSQFGSLMKIILEAMPPQTTP